MGWPGKRETYLNDESAFWLKPNPPLPLPGGDGGKGLCSLQTQKETEPMTYLETKGSEYLPGVAPTGAEDPGPPVPGTEGPRSL